MKARKTAKVSKPGGRKNLTPKKAAAAKAKSSPAKKSAKKAATKAAPSSKSLKKPSVSAKALTKTGDARAVRKAPSARKKSPEARRPKGKSKAPEANPVDVSVTMESSLSPVEASHDPVRGGDHDAANHSKPDVQLQRQHIVVLRSPERRHTMRGH